MRNGTLTRFVLNCVIITLRSQLEGYIILSLQFLPKIPHTNVQNLTSTYPLPPPPHPSTSTGTKAVFREQGTPKSKKKNAFREQRNTRKILLGTREQGTPWEALKTMFNFQLKGPVYFCFTLFDSIGSHFHLITVTKINILRFYGNGEELDVLLRWAPTPSGE